MRAWRLAQWRHRRVGGIPFSLGYKFRRDSADFRPADIVVTHTSPSSAVRRFTTDEEYITSQAHEFAVATGGALVRTSGWRLTGMVSASPLLIARLATRLPQK